MSNTDPIRSIEFQFILKFNLIIISLFFSLSRWVPINQSINFAHQSMIEFLSQFCCKRFDLNILLLVIRNVTLFRMCRFYLVIICQNYLMFGQNSEITWNCCLFLCEISLDTMETPGVFLETLLFYLFRWNSNTQSTDLLTHSSVLFYLFSFSVINPLRPDPHFLSYFFCVCKINIRIEFAVKKLKERENPLRNTNTHSKYIHKRRVWNRTKS